MTSQTAFGDAREKFQRLQQISTILNLDKVNIILTYSHVRGTDPIDFIQEEDVDEFYNSSGIPWKLTETEARAVSGLRV